jgi:hypothetical protein
MAVMGFSPTEKTRGSICPAAIILRDEGALHDGLALLLFKSPCPYPRSAKVFLQALAATKSGLSFDVPVFSESAAHEFIL